MMPSGSIFGCDSFSIMSLLLIRITINWALYFLTMNTILSVGSVQLCWLLSCFSPPGGVGKVRSNQLVPDPCWWTPDKDGSGGQARGGWGATRTQGKDGSDIPTYTHRHNDKALDKFMFRPICQNFGVFFIVKFDCRNNFTQCT